VQLDLEVRSHHTPVSTFVLILPVDISNDASRYKHRQGLRSRGSIKESRRHALRVDYNVREHSHTLYRTTRLTHTLRAFIHLYLRYTQPLFVDAIMDLLSLYDSKLIKVHIFGQPAEGELKRPFKSMGPFGEPTRKLDHHETKS
jgi:hypothetical protein